MSESVIYSLDIRHNDLQAPASKLRLVRWQPGSGNGLRSKRFPFKYNLFWFYHFLGLFKNKNYSAFLLYEEDTVVSALMAIPAYSRWPFMGPKDVQLIYVITHPDHRRKGLGATLIHRTLDHLKNSSDVEKVWYVTTTDNLASRKLCEKLGFSFAGSGLRKVRFGGLFKKLLLNKG